MKTTARPTASAFFSVLFAAALAAAPARAGWFSSEKSELLDRADAEYAAATAAAKNYEIVTQMTALRKALASYRQLERQYPDYSAEKVNNRIREIVFTLGALDEKIRRGELSIPADEIPAARTAQAGDAPPPVGKKPTEPDAPAFRRPIPELVRTGDPRPDAAPAAAPAEPSSDAAWLRESLPNLLAAAPAPAASAARPAAPAVAAVPAPEDPARLARYAEMIRAGRATEAVMELEDLVADEGAAASVGTRAMFARALLACGNNARAADELKAIPASADGDPAVLSLRVASAVALGDLPRALLLLDRLVTDFPDYSDAYVDFAYVRFLSDPANPDARDEAVVYYRQALMRGARRDTRLEEELGIRVE